MAYADRQMSSSRIVAIIIVALIHAVLGYAFVTGLAYNVVKKAAEDLNVFDVEEEPPPPEEEPPPPPPDQPVEPPPVVSPPPIVQTNVAPPPIINTQQVIRPPAPPSPLPPVQAAPPPPPPPPPPQPSQAARARADLRSLFSTDDYPSSALRAEEEGTTAVRLTVGPDGRVSACTVTSSSGSSTLDNATCSILRRKARFTPAKDTAGNNIVGSSSTRITWRIPEE